MNAVFFVFCSLSLIFCIVFNPSSALEAMISGANKSLVLLFTLAPVYSVWMGVLKILEEAKVTNFIAKKLNSPVKKLFKTNSEKSAKLISLNVVANALGLGGVATPLGIKACKSLEQENNLRGANLLVVLSASSIQLLPTSVISLCHFYGAINPESIILPTLICTIFSTLCSFSLFCLGERLLFKKANEKPFCGFKK